MKTVWLCQMKDIILTSLVHSQSIKFYKINMFVFSLYGISSFCVTAIIISVSYL